MTYCTMVVHAVQEYRTLWKAGVVSNKGVVPWKFNEKGKIKRGPVVHYSSRAEVQALCNFFNPKSKSGIFSVLSIINMEGWADRISSVTALDRPPMSHEQMDAMESCFWEEAVRQSAGNGKVSPVAEKELDQLVHPKDK